MQPTHPASEGPLLNPHLLMKMAKLFLLLTSLLGLAWATTSKSRRGATIHLSFELGATAHHELFESVFFTDKGAESSKIPSTNDSCPESIFSQREDPGAARTETQDEEWPEVGEVKWVFECVSYRRHRGTGDIITQTELIDYEMLHNFMPSLPGPLFNGYGKEYPHYFRNWERLTWQVNRKDCDSYQGLRFEFPIYADMRLFDHAAVYEYYFYEERRRKEGFDWPDPGPPPMEPGAIRAVYLHRGEGDNILCDVIVHPWEKSIRSTRQWASGDQARPGGFQQCRLKELNR
jgi:hypothetical protein